MINDDLRNPPPFEYPGGITARPKLATLTVSDIERLAKAGVKVEFKEIAEQVVPDASAPHPGHRVWDTWDLQQPLYDRWNRAQCQGRTRSPYRVMESPPFKAAVTDADGKIYVYVHWRGLAPVIIEDDPELYPSDALMASLLLLAKDAKAVLPGDIDAGSVETPKSEAGPLGLRVGPGGPR